MKKLEYIDSLRGLAILAVLMVHTAVYGSVQLPGLLENITKQGARGVQLFYIVSAFTLFLSLKNRSDKEHFPIRNFFVRRFFRVAPFYYLGIVYFLVQDGLGAKIGLGDQTSITPFNIIGNFLFIHGFYPYWLNSIVPGGWSIAVEMTFYAALPFLFSRIKNITHAFNFITISLIIRFLLDWILSRHNLISSPSLWSGYLFWYFPSQLPIFGLGILLYFFIAENASINDISGKSLLAFAGLLIFQLSIGRYNLFPYHFLFGISFLILSIALAKYRFTLITNPVINYIGKISFSMYLVHFAVLHWMSYFNLVDYSSNGALNFAIRYIIVFAISTLISGVAYQLIEAPFQRLGKKLIDKLEKKQSPLIRPHLQKTMEVKQ